MSGRRKKGALARGLIVTVAVFAALAYGGVRLLDYVSAASREAELELVQDAVQRAVITCYAVEGAYPWSLDYLKGHYGLVYDEENYFVFYDAFASNVLPEIHVTEKGAEL